MIIFNFLLPYMMIFKYFNSRLIWIYFNFYLLFFILVIKIILRFLHIYIRILNTKYLTFYAKDTKF